MKNINNEFIKVELEALIEMHKKLIAKCMQLDTQDYFIFINAISKLEIHKVVNEVIEIYVDEIPTSVKLDKEICKKIKFLRTILKFVLELILVSVNSKAENRILSFAFKVLNTIKKMDKLECITPFSVNDFIENFKISDQECIRSNVIISNINVCLYSNIIISNIDIILMVKLLHFTGNLSYRPKANLVLTSYSKTEMDLVYLVPDKIDYKISLLEFLNELKK